MKPQGRLMVVDDTKFIRDLFVRYLELDGHEVYSAESGVGLDLALKKHKVELLVLDVNMPGPSLTEILSRLKDDDSLKDIPIILVSGCDQDQALDEAFEMGVDDFLQKPPNFHLLRSRVSAHLARGQFAGARRELRAAWSNNILDISRLAEGREPDTDRHLERIREYCRFLGAEYRKQVPSEISEDWLDAFVCVAPLHDIGKSKIPDSVLLKSDVLTEPERALIKAHSSLGAGLAANFLDQCSERSFLELGGQLTRFHHERWDGAGYPDGRSGSDIPLAARILSVCDVYDALRSRRPHRSGYSHDDAVKIIQDGKGSQFDPEITQLFSSSTGIFGDIYGRLHG